MAPASLAPALPAQHAVRHLNRDDINSVCSYASVTRRRLLHAHLVGSAAIATGHIFLCESDAHRLDALPNHAT
jgi:hypothetical protein